MGNFIRFTDVVKTFHLGDVAVHALDHLSFGVDEGEFVVVVGPSGAGKTTLLNLLGGMDSPTGGEIAFGDRVVSGFNAKQLTEYRRTDVGFVFQFYNLMPNLTALENVELAVEICPDPIAPHEALAAVGLANREASFPAQLSGGEQQRVSIARAIAKNPRLILCDEPTGALDYETGKKILALLHEVCRTQGKTVILVTHNGALRAMADKVVHVRNGRVQSVEVNEHPVPVADIEW